MKRLITNEWVEKAAGIMAAQRGKPMNISITACLVSVLLHELAHIATAKALGVRIKRVGVSWKGPYIVREPGTPAQNLCISLAGPAVNALLMLVPGWFLVNFVLLVPNLILKHSDGRRAWKCWQVIVSSKNLGPALLTGQNEGQ